MQQWVQHQQGAGSCTSTCLLAGNLSAYIVPSRSSEAAAPPALLQLLLVVIAADIWLMKYASIAELDGCSNPDTGPFEANRRYACLSDWKSAEQATS